MLSAGAVRAKRMRELLAPLNPLLRKLHRSRPPRPRLLRRQKRPPLRRPPPRKRVQQNRKETMCHRLRRRRKASLPPRQPELPSLKFRAPPSGIRKLATRPRSCLGFLALHAEADADKDERRRMNRKGFG